jgi:hypothetical protein
MRDELLLRARLRVPVRECTRSLASAAPPGARLQPPHWTPHYDPHAAPPPDLARTLRRNATGLNIPYVHAAGIPYIV